MAGTERCLLGAVACRGIGMRPNLAKTDIPRACYNPLHKYWDRDAPVVDGPTSHKSTPFKPIETLFGIGVLPRTLWVPPRDRRL